MSGEYAGAQVRDVLPSLHHRRTQHAVGQGLFHSALITGQQSRQRFHYVYDCGSMDSYASERNAAISRYRGSLHGDDLDVLFVSHAHADHVNGIPDLLNGLHVRTIVMPLLTPQERLLAWARSYAEDASVLFDGDYAAWIADPVAAAAAYGPDRIVQVAAGAPAVGDDSPTDPDRSGDPRVVELPPVALPDDRLIPGPPSWDLVGSGDPEVHAEDGTAVYRIPDTLAMRPHVGATEVPWILSMHVAPEVESGVELFLAALAEDPEIPPVGWWTWPDEAGFLRWMIERKAAVLRAAYERVKKDINITSLCLYSGPSSVLSPDIAADVRTRRGCHATAWQSVTDGRVGWIGTGDASLRHQGRRAAFLSHYRPFADEVLTMTLPHHGSRDNFSNELLIELGPTFCVAPAAAYGTWQHPHPLVQEAVETSGRVLVNVSADDRSELVECFRFFRPSESDEWRRSGRSY